MKKVGLLTLDSRMYNYGGVLQEYALQCAIEKLGAECEIIDYDVASEQNTFSIKRSIRNFSFYKIIEKIEKKKKSGTMEEVKEQVAVRKKAFDRFREQNMKLSRRYVYPQLQNAKLDYDALVCGSDQIWNPDYNRPAFFLGFAEESTATMIYAASVGKAQLTNRQKKIYSDYMKPLDYVSVREASAKKLFAESADQKIEVVLDPTLLHDEEFWKQHLDDRYEKLPKYLFCYFLDYTEEKAEAVRRYAEAKELKIVIIPYLHDRKDEVEEGFGDIRIYDAGPEGFLNLIHSADEVVTDSFHATVFSLIFGKDFRVFGRQSGNYNMNTRIENLLGYFDAGELLIRPEELGRAEKLQKKLSMSKIKELRRESLDFLKQIVK